MRERGILFSSSMVKAILDGRKTQTRRAVRWKLREEGLNIAFSGLVAGCYSCDDDQRTGFVLRSRGAGSCWNDRTWPAHSPYGLHGDRLWVRETWQMFDPHPDGDLAVVGAERLSRGRRAPWVGVVNNRPIEWTTAYRADGELEHPTDGPACWKPSIFMPRWASRITLEIVEVRVQRLNEISEDDARAEGCTGRPEPVVEGGSITTPRSEFAALWDSINGKRAPWSSNLWVWVLTFRRIP